jgi:dTDP-4-dehydrorhamnose reductase
MLKLSENRKEIKVVADQYGIPTNCTDLSLAMSNLIDVLDEFIQR